MYKINNITIAEMQKEMNTWFAGQPALKKAFAVFGHAHIQKFSNPSVQLPQTVIMLNGRTGSGKTFCASQFARYLGVPFYRINATTLGQGGSWHGDDIAKQIYQEYSQRHSDYRDYGILYIDEIDKISNDNISSSGNNVSHNVQASLLDVLEGQTLRYDKHEINTSKFLVILSGSFETQLEENVDKKASIGFTGKKEEELPKTQEEWRNFYSKQGMIKEIVGRITTVMNMEKLTDSEIRHAILNLEDSAYNKYYNLCTLYNRTFVLGEDRINEIIEQTKKSEYGLRHINMLITQIALDFLSNECHDSYIKVPPAPSVELIISDVDSDVKV